MPAVQRARRRLRRRRSRHPGRARRRRVDRERRRRSGRRWRTSRRSGCCSPAPIPTRRSTRASPRSSSTCTSPASRCGPIRSMAGASGFNEVFFTDATVPDSMRVGDIGDGWRVANATLMNERVVDRQRGRAAGLGPDRRRRRRVEAVRRDQTPAAARPADAGSGSTPSCCASAACARRPSARRACRAPRARCSSSCRGACSPGVSEIVVELMGADGMLCTPYTAAQADERRGRRAAIRCWRSSARRAAPSPAAPPRSSGTSWGSGSSVCPASRASTPTRRGARSRGTEGCADTSASMQVRELCVVYVTALVLLESSAPRVNAACKLSLEPLVLRFAAGLRSSASVAVRRSRCLLRGQGRDCRLAAAWRAVARRADSVGVSAGACRGAVMLR